MKGSGTDSPHQPSLVFEIGFTFIQKCVNTLYFVLCIKGLAEDINLKLQVIL
jgi:hypothetical protein